MSHREVSPCNMWDVHVMGRWADIFIFLLSKDVNSYEMNLGSKKEIIKCGSIRFRGYLKKGAKSSDASFEFHMVVFTLACPCLPVLDVLISMILQGKPLIMTKPFFLRAEHCCGNVVEAPDSAVVKSPSSI